MFKAAAAASTVVLAFLLVAAQQRSTSRSSGSQGTRFEVASVRECKPTDKNAQSRSSPVTLSLGCWPLRELIQQAYDVFASGTVDILNPGTPSAAIEGLPDWVNSARYSIDAKTDSPQSAAMMRGPMMQSLLEERFDLKVHKENREVPVYLLTLAKGRARLHETRAGTCMPYDFSEALNMKPTGQTLCAVPVISRKGPLTVLDVHGITLGAFAKMLHPDGLHVIDKTGLNGMFDVHLEWEHIVGGQSDTGAAVASDPSVHASEMVALREQLGLQLNRGRGMSEFLVVDHIEKAGEN